MRQLRDLRHLLAGAYAWMLAVFLGAVLLDIVYSGLLKDANGFVAASVVFSEVADFLLMLGAFTILSAFAAVVLAWDVGSARNLFLASSLLLIGFEFLVPVILFPILRSAQGSALLGLGPVIRLLPTALASLLAFAGVRDLHRQQNSGLPA
jgi:hypothetical protein